MNYNYEPAQIILDGAELLYNMLRDVTEIISHLPGCGMAANIKRVAANIGTAGEGVYRTIKNVAANMDDWTDDTDEYDESDISTGSDLREFLDLIGSILDSGKPVSISADIYISEGEAENIGDTESEE